MAERVGVLNRLRRALRPKGNHRMRRVAEQGHGAMTPARQRRTGQERPVTIAFRAADQRAERRRPLVFRQSLRHVGAAARRDGSVRRRFFKDNDNIDDRAVAQRIMHDMRAGQQPEMALNRPQGVGRAFGGNQGPPGAGARINRRIGLLRQNLRAHGGAAAIRANKPSSRKARDAACPLRLNLDVSLLRRESGDARVLAHVDQRVGARRA